MFKLDLKQMALTAFRTPVQNGLMQKVNIFCTENEHLHAFYTPTKNRKKLDKGIMLIFVSEKNRPLLLAKGVLLHVPLARYVKLRVARAPGMPGTFSPHTAG